MIFSHEVERIIRDYGWRPSLRVLDDRLLDALDGNRPSSSYSDDQSRALSSQAESSWWYTTRNDIIFRAIHDIGITETLWDIGSGAGEVSVFLAQKGFKVVCLEPSLAGASISAARGISSIVGDLSVLRLPDNCIAHVGMFDVLEHVENREDFLRNVFRVMKPGGTVFVTVPALKSLWGQLDVEAGHYVRYSRNAIRRELISIGFECVSTRYFFFSLVLPLLLLRAIPFRLGLSQPISDGSLLRQDGGRLSKLLTKFEVHLAKYFPLGSSILVVAKKPY